MAVHDLAEAGVSRMTGAEIEDFLATRGSGVLGLPAEDAPYLLPLSYGFDGTDALYFTYVLGADSRKERLTERAQSASFLVYTATTPFQWRSVLLSGTVEAVDPDEYDAVSASLSEAWQPAAFEEVESTRARIYRFAIADRTGLKHTGLPPALRDDPERATGADEP